MTVIVIELTSIQTAGGRSQPALGDTRRPPGSLQSLAAEPQM
jgi:hypothetical protein